MAAVTWKTSQFSKVNSSPPPPMPSGNWDPSSSAKILHFEKWILAADRKNTAQGRWGGLERMVIPSKRSQAFFLPYTRRKSNTGGCEGSAASSFNQSVRVGSWRWNGDGRFVIGSNAFDVISIFSRGDAYHVATSAAGFSCQGGLHLFQSFPRPGLAAIGVRGVAFVVEKIGSGLEGVGQQKEQHDRQSSYRVGTHGFHPDYLGDVLWGLFIPAVWVGAIRRRRGSGWGL